MRVWGGPSTGWQSQGGLVSGVRAIVLLCACAAAGAVGWMWSSAALTSDPLASFDGSVVVWVSDPDQYVDVQVNIAPNETTTTDATELEVVMGWGERFDRDGPPASTRWLIALTGDAQLADTTWYGPSLDLQSAAPSALGEYNGEPAQFFTGTGPNWVRLKGQPAAQPLVVGEERTTLQMPTLMTDFYFDLPGKLELRDDLPVRGDWYQPGSVWLQLDSGLRRSTNIRVEDATPAEDLVSDSRLVWGGTDPISPQASLLDLSSAESSDRKLFFGALLLGVSIPLAVDAILEIVTAALKKRRSGTRRGSRTRFRGRPRMRKVRHLAGGGGGDQRRQTARANARPRS